MAQQQRLYHFFVVKYEKNRVRQSAKLRATDKRRAKLLAKQRFGDEIRILTAHKLGAN